LKAWSSTVYDHFNITLERKGSGDATKLIHIFTCKYGSKDHPVQRRERAKAGRGTTNLARTIATCDAARGHLAAISTPAGMPLVGEYTQARHRAIVALRCATSARPAHVVADKYYLMEVECLRPGTIPPSPIMVSRDIHLLHEQIAVFARAYFVVSDLIFHRVPSLITYNQARNRSIHLSADGWTNPSASSLLGLVVTWHDKGVIYHALLDMIKSAAHLRCFFMRSSFFQACTQPYRQVHG
jgi:hypothetical protein